MIRATPSAALTSSIPQRAHLVLVKQPAPKAREHLHRKLSEAMSASGCASQAYAQPDQRAAGCSREQHREHAVMIKPSLTAHLTMAGRTSRKSLVDTLPDAGQQASPCAAAPEGYEGSD
jgi:hypothetical protein